MRKKPRPETSALYVQIPRSEAEKLDRAAFELKARKRDLVAALVARYVDPSTAEGLERLRALGAQAEVPEPPRPEPRRREPYTPTVRISAASDWVAGMQRSIREFAKGRNCPHPFVRATLDDGDELFLQAMAPGPNDDFVTVTAYEPRDATTRVVVVRLGGIKKVELFATAPDGAKKAFVFHPRTTGVGFATD